MAPHCYRHHGLPAKRASIVSGRAHRARDIVPRTCRTDDACTRRSPRRCPHHVRATHTDDVVTVTDISEVHTASTHERTADTHPMHAVPDQERSEAALEFAVREYALGEGFFFFF